MGNKIYRCILARTTLYILSCKWAIRSIDVFSHAILYICFPVNVQSDLAYAILARNTLYMLSSECAIRYIDVFSHAIVNICFSVGVQSDLPMYSRTQYFIYTFQ